MHFYYVNTVASNREMNFVHISDIYIFILNKLLSHIVRDTDFGMHLQSISGPNMKIMNGMMGWEET